MSTLTKKQEVSMVGPSAQQGPAVEPGVAVAGERGPTVEGDGRGRQQLLHVGDVVQATVSAALLGGVLVCIAGHGGRHAFLAAAEISRRRAGALAAEVLKAMVGGTFLVKVVAISAEGVDVSKVEVTPQEKRANKKAAKQAHRLERKLAWLTAASGLSVSRVVELVGTQDPDEVDERFVQVAQDEQSELAPFLTEYLPETPDQFVAGVLRKVLRCTGLSFCDLQSSVRLEIVSFWKEGEVPAADLVVALARAIVSGGARARSLLEGLLEPVLTSDEWCSLQTLYLLETQHSEGRLGQDEFVAVVGFLRDAELVRPDVFEDWRANRYEEGALDVRAFLLEM